MNHVLQHTLNRQAMAKKAAYVASPLRKIGGPRPIGVQTAP